MKKPLILILLPLYFPSSKAGGAATAIRNLMESVSQEYDFEIVTSDQSQDNKEPQPRSNSIDDSNCAEPRVHYLPSGILAIKRLLEILKSRSFHKVYINSFFSIRFCLIPVLLSYFLPKTPFLISPRGELLPNILRLHYSLSKRIYLFFVQILGLYRNTQFIASSNEEMTSIDSQLLSKKPTALLMDIITTNYAYLPFANNLSKPKLIYISRIETNKGLDVLIQALKLLKRHVCLDIYGPIINLKYWEYCMKLVSEDTYTDINYRGIARSEDINRLFASSELFVFPTHGESNGYVITEAISSGCIVITSKHVPWASILPKTMLVVAAGDTPRDYAQCLAEYLDLSSAERFRIRSLIHSQSANMFKEINSYSLRVLDSMLA